MDGWGFIAVLLIIGGLIAIALVAVTVVGAARAWRHEHYGWVALILGAWILGMGWAAALFYLVAVDASRDPRPARDPSSPPRPLP